MMKRMELGIDLRQLIVNKHETRKGYDEISKERNVVKSTPVSIINKFKMTRDKKNLL